MAAAALLDQEPEALGDVSLLDSGDPLLRRVLVLAADARGDVAMLRQASRDGDARVRSLALGARTRHDDVDEAEREHLASDPDPWVRRAVLDEANAERLLATDPQPSLRRAAFGLVADRRRASLLACTTDDPWLRARSAMNLDAQRLLVLSRDRSAAVRAAAVEALERKGDAAIEEVLRADPSADVRIAAYTWLSRAFDEAAHARLRASREAESPAVRRWIDDVLGEARPAVTSVETPSRAKASQRPLGATGMELPALAVSGVGNLATDAYAEALDAGCNAFFWEPRYHALGRMLSRKREARIIAGTYHASERAIVSDVERSLRRLRRDALDVFLLFWVRSAARVDDETFGVLSRLKEQGKVRAIGFSTHHRDLACDAIRVRPWDVVMTRYKRRAPRSRGHALSARPGEGRGHPHLQRALLRQAAHERDSRDRRVPLWSLAARRVGVPVGAEDKARATRKPRRPRGADPAGCAPRGAPRSGSHRPRGQP